MADINLTTVRHRLNIEWDPSDPTEYVAMLFLDRLKMLPYHQRKNWLKGAIIDHVDAFLQSGTEDVPPGMEGTQHLMQAIAHQSGVTLPLRDSTITHSGAPYRPPSFHNGGDVSPGTPERRHTGKDQALSEPDGADAPDSPPSAKAADRESEPQRSEPPQRTPAEAGSGDSADQGGEQNEGGETIASSPLANKLRSLGGG